VLERRLLASASGQGSFTPPIPVYRASAHTNATPEKAYTFESDDGLAWTQYGSSPAIATTLRDPSLLQWGGTWWIAATAGGGLNETDYFYLFTSADGVTWAGPTNIDTSPPGTTATWAPHWFVDPDGDPHILTALRVGGVRVLYELHPTNAGMTTWSAPSAIGGTGWATNNIDPDLTHYGGTYYLIYKDDDAGTLCLATSTSAFSGYTTTKTGDWAGWKSGAGGGSIEGPIIMDIVTGWRVYYTQNSGLSAVNAYRSETTDRTMATDWSSPSAIASFDGYNHSLPIRVTGS